MVGAAGRRSADADTRDTYATRAWFRRRGAGSSPSNLDHSPGNGDPSGCHPAICALSADNRARARRSTACCRHARAARANSNAGAWGYVAACYGHAAPSCANSHPTSCCANPRAVGADGHARAARADGYPAAASANSHAVTSYGYARVARANGYPTCCYRDLTARANGHTTCCNPNVPAPNADGYAIT